jgi:hypothetical protein
MHVMAGLLRFSFWTTRQLKQLTSFNHENYDGLMAQKRESLEQTILSQAELGGLHVPRDQVNLAIPEHLQGWSKSLSI